MTLVGRNVRVSGRVQGVFFRAWTQQQAQALGVTGWVRNCPDGSVEAHLAGESEAVEALVQRLRHGPQGARVDDTQIVEVTAEPGSSFEVRH